MHTPAPWTAEATRNGKTFEVYFGDAEAGESGAGWCTLSGANQADNARLIASAPELLAFAQAVANYPGADAGLVIAAREVIAKALGE